MLSEAAIKVMLLAAGFTEIHLPTMLCIAKWESSNNPAALNVNSNGTKDYGLFQINEKYWAGKGDCAEVDELMDPENNVKCAKYVYDQMGYDAWIAYRTREECNPMLAGPKEHYIDPEMLEKGEVF